MPDLTHQGTKATRLARPGRPLSPEHRPNGKGQLRGDGRPLNMRHNSRLNMRHISSWQSTQ